MHVVVMGGRPETVHALVDCGHEVTLLYADFEHARVAGYRDRLKYSCAVDSHLVVESHWSALHHLGALRDGVDAVVATQEYAVVPAAVLGGMLGARALDPAVALRCRDKALQKAAWREAGIPTADWLLVPDAGDTAWWKAALEGESGFGPPYVLKPPAGGGSADVAFAQDRRELEALVGRALRAEPARRRVLIEQHVSGDEWHFDGVVQDGVLHSLLVSRYLTPVIETKHGRPVSTVSFVPGDHPELYAEAADITARALRALGLSHGVFHFELFGKPGHFVANELAARPGGLMVGRLVDRVLGVDIWGATAQVHTGDPIGRSPMRSDRVSGFTTIPTVAGAVNRLAGADIAAIPGVVEVEMQLPPGTVMGDMAANAAVRVGSVLVEAATERACRDVLAEVLETALRINGNGDGAALDRRPR
jgi:ATP-grasp domain